LELLNDKPSNFDITKVIDMIPNNWSIKLTHQFVENVLQSNLRRKRTALVEKHISHQFKFLLQKELFNLKKEQLYVDDDR
jgi:hypothetical protein